MSYTKEITLFCDSCGQWEREPFANVMEIRRYLKRTAGWDRVLGHDYCEDCMKADPKDGPQ